MELLTTLICTINEALLLSLCVCAYALVTFIAIYPTYWIVSRLYRILKKHGA